MSFASYVPPFLERKWKSTSRRKSRTLLRLSLLRELYGGLHASKSSSLARGDHPALEVSAFLEKNIIAIAFNPDASLPTSLVRWSKQIQKAKESVAFESGANYPAISSLPAKLIDAVGRDRLQRSARSNQPSQKWELLLTSIAHSLRFSFWTLVAETAVEDAEQFQAHLARSLWPKGILLFTRTVGIRSDSHRWQGQWTIALEQGTKITPNLSRIGTWKRIHP